MCGRDVLYKNVKKNHLGYYELNDSCRKIMNAFYENEYYQNNMALYKQEEYPREDVLYKKYTFAEREYVYKRIGGELGAFLDIGCGEGYAMKFFNQNNWRVIGVDYSIAGLEAHNPDMKEFVIKCDVEDFLAATDMKFDFINIDHVLEHLPDINNFFAALKRVCKKNTILCISVPNDFSITQLTAFDNGFIDDAFWVTDKTSEHFNYFSLYSLINLADYHGYQCCFKIADWPIDYYLLNPRTNYYKDSSLGHDGYIGKIMFENMLYESSMDKAVALHEAIAEMGIGRDLTVFLKEK